MKNREIDAICKRCDLHMDRVIRVQEMPKSVIIVSTAAYLE